MIIQNPKLNNIQRYVILQDKLEGNEKNVIKGLTPSDENYETALRLLQERYGNKRMIIQTHVNELFNLKPIVKDSGQSLTLLVDDFRTNLEALKSQGLPTESWDVIMIHLVTSKFYYQTRRAWEEILTINELPSVDQLLKFLHDRGHLLNALYSKQNNTNSAKPVVNKKGVSFVSTQRSYKCPYCQEDHAIYMCNKFKEMVISDRIKLIKKLNLCSNCLSKNHLVAQCRSHYTCKHCKGRHNSMLHLDDTNNASNHDSNEISVTSTCTVFEQNQKVFKVETSAQVILSTVVVLLYDSENNQHLCRALLDSGSQSNFMTTSLCKRLKLKTKNIDNKVSGINSEVINIGKTTTAKIKSKFNEFTASLSFLIIPKITEQLPLKSVNVRELNIPLHVQLSDPQFHKPGTLDLLLGASIFWDLLCGNQIKLLDNQPGLYETTLGWVISGTFGDPNLVSNSKLISCFTITHFDLQNQLKQFWELEECNAKSYFSKDERACEDHFVKTHKRSLSGRFQVRLPLKESALVLGDSKESAKRQFFNLEGKLENQPEIHKSYKAFIDEYKQLNHLSLIKETDKTDAIFYLPHYAVFKAESTTTKLQVVYNASAKTSNGKSLNDMLMVGPTIQSSLLNIVIRFRQHAYVLIGDITKMYRQVEIQEDQRDLQRIIWRDNSSEPLQSFHLNTVTYGTASAPFLAIRCLFQLAFENEKCYPEISKIIKTDFYVDDLLTGSNNIENLRRIKLLTTEILAQGGFPLRKFQSNVQDIIETDVSDSSIFTITTTTTTSF